jgi:Cof subfamily protein (haloacid dehalogenase superfamily)
MTGETGSFRKRFVFFDIDNTLAVGTPGDQYVPESAEKALKELREAGHFTAIATGRAHAMAEDYRKKLGFNNMVSDGGYGITINGELKELRPLPYEPCLALIKECREKKIPWAIQIDDSDTRIAPDDSFLEASHDIYMKTRVVPDLDLSRVKAIYKLYVAGPYPIENEIEALKDLPYCRYHDTYFFIEPTDKAYGIRKMVEMMGGDPKDVVVFGDGLNDLSMFIKDWTSVAMGNAVPELKERADFVTRDAADDGIYYACAKLGLLKQNLL